MRLVWSHHHMGAVEQPGGRQHFFYGNEQPEPLCIRVCCGMDVFLYGGDQTG